MLKHFLIMYCKDALDTLLVFLPKKADLNPNPSTKSMISSATSLVFILGSNCLSSIPLDKTLDIDSDIFFLFAIKPSAAQSTLSRSLELTHVVFE